MALIRSTADIMHGLQADTTDHLLHVLQEIKANNFLYNRTAEREKYRPTAGVYRVLAALSDMLKDVDVTTENLPRFVRAMERQLPFHQITGDQQLNLFNCLQNPDPHNADVNTLLVLCKSLLPAHLEPEIPDSNKSMAAFLFKDRHHQLDIISQQIINPFVAMDDVVMLCVSSSQTSHDDQRVVELWSIDSLAGYWQSQGKFGLPAGSPEVIHNLEAATGFILAKHPECGDIIRACQLQAEAERAEREKFEKIKNEENPMSKTSMQYLINIACQGSSAQAERPDEPGKATADIEEPFVALLDYIDYLKKSDLPQNNREAFNLLSFKIEGRSLNSVLGGVYQLECVGETKRNLAKTLFEQVQLPDETMRVLQKNYSKSSPGWVERRRKIAFDASEVNVDLMMSVSARADRVRANVAESALPPIIARADGNIDHKAYAVDRGGPGSLAGAAPIATARDTTVRQSISRPDIDFEKRQRERASANPNRQSIQLTALAPERDRKKPGCC